MYNLLLILAVCAFVTLLPFLGQPAWAQTATQDQSLTNDQTFNQTGGNINFPSGTALRGYSIPGESPLPPFLPTPPHFAPPVTDGNYGNLSTILDYKDNYTQADAEALLQKHKKMRVITNCLIPENLRTSKPFLRILPTPKDKAAFKRQYELIGVGNYKSMNPKSISEQVLGVAIREGLRIGADAMLFQEGAALIQTAKGWSIGLFNSLSTTNVPGGTGYGNVAVGGIGYGKGESGYESKPWLRVQFFKELPTAAAVRRYTPTTPAKPAKPPAKTEVNTYEESLQKPGKEPTPEDAYLLKESLPQPQPPSRR